MKKRLISAFFASILLIFALCVPATAEETDNLKKGSISASMSNSAVIDANGSLWTWGDNTYGRVGNGTIQNAYSPVKVMDDVAQVFAGAATAAIKTDGSLWMWGSSVGIGDGTIGNATAAYGGLRCQTVPIKIMDGVATMVNDGLCTAVVKTDGSLWTWYIYDESGGHRVDSPVKVLDNVVSVAVEESASLRMAAITEDNALWIWGSNVWGQVGNGSSDGYVTTPVRIMEDVAAVYLEDFYTVALKTDGSLWAWGNNTGNRLGTGTGQDSYVPVKIMGGVKSFTAEYSINAAIKEDNTLWMWGFIFPGDGTPNKVDYATPTKIMNDVTSVTIADMESLAVIKTDGSLWAWGSNDHGTVGNGTREPVYTPVKILDHVVAAGYADHGIAVTEDGSLWMWGGQTNAYGSMGTGTTDFSYTPKKIAGLTLRIADEAPESTVGGFSDVKISDYYADPVLWAVENGITVGTSETTFSPDATCTHAQILTFLWRAYGSPEPTIENPFLDINAADYYYKAALWAYQMEMVSGNTFYGDTACTRASTVMYLWQAAGEPTPASTSVFHDVADDASYGHAVAWAVEQGITYGTGNGTFSPDQICNRGQIMTFLYRNLG